MASRETSNASEDLDRRQFLVTAALTAAASCDVLGSAEKAGSLVEARQNLVADFEGCNLGLIMAHRPELTPAENRARIGELRANIGNRFGLLQVRGRYVPEPGAEPIDEYAFLLGATRAILAT